MNKAQYILLGLIIGYFMALGCNTSIVAQDYGDTFQLGTRYNPMYVKLVE